MRVAIEIVRIVLVMALVCVAAVILTPKGRIPLALRGLAKLLKKKDYGICEPLVVSPAKRLLGFLLIVFAFILALIRL